MICVLNAELSTDSSGNGGATGSISNDVNNDDLKPCQCGGSSEPCSLKKDYYRSNPDDPDSYYLNHVKRTENNMFFYPGDEFCSNQNNFIHKLARIFGYIIVAITYIIAISLLAWILMNLKHRIVNHSQPIFLIKIMNAYSGLIRLPQVIELTGLSERTIYRYEGKGYFRTF